MMNSLKNKVCCVTLEVALELILRCHNLKSDEGGVGEGELMVSLAAGDGREQVFFRRVLQGLRHQFICIDIKRGPKDISAAQDFQ